MQHKAASLYVFYSLTLNPNVKILNFGLEIPTMHIHIDAQTYCEETTVPTRNPGTEPSVPYARPCAEETAQFPERIADSHRHICG